jgi:DNA-binding PadR family transcriptional regulator
MLEDAQLSNSFVILLSLINSKKPLTTNQISEIISKKSQGEIYKNPGTIKDVLDKRLVREEFVSSKIIENKTQYSITSKGEKLLKGWIGFLYAITEYK